MLRPVFALFIVGLSFFCVPVHSEVGTAAFSLEMRQGPRQGGMGGAGVAVPDRARSSHFNPALPAFSFPRGRTAISWHPAWIDLVPGYTRMVDWNGPLLPNMDDLGPWYGSVLYRLPAVYYQHLGYLAYDRKVIRYPQSDDVEESEWSLTWSVAEDAFQRGPARDLGAFAWTGGLSFHRFETGFRYLDSLGTVSRTLADGMALDVGASARLELPYLPKGMEQYLGLAFLNIGTDAEYKYRNDPSFRDPLPMQYRLGWSGIYKPMEAQIRFRRKWTPLRFLATLEIDKGFAGRDSDGEPLAPFPAFFHEMRGLPGRYLREMVKRGGVEATALEIVHLRWGTYRDRRENDDPWYTYGWGLATGPLFGDFFLNYDYSRELSTYHNDTQGNHFPRREWALQLGYVF